MAFRAGLPLLLAVNLRKGAVGGVSRLAAFEVIGCGGQFAAAATLVLTGFRGNLPLAGREAFSPGEDLSVESGSLGFRQMPLAMVFSVQGLAVISREVAGSASWRGVELFALFGG